jgi:hypothetical protein
MAMEERHYRMTGFWTRRGTRYKNYSDLFIRLNHAILARELTIEMANNIMDFTINDFQIRFKFNSIEEEELFENIIIPRFTHFKRVWFE